QAVLIDRDDQRRAFDCNGPGKPKCEIVGGVIQLGEVGGPGQQQDRNGHETTGGYRSQERSHRRVLYTAARQYNCTRSTWHGGCIPGAFLSWCLCDEG